MAAWSTPKRCACLALVVIGAYASALPGGFVWLDHTEIEAGGYRVLNESDAGNVWTQSLDAYMERREGTLVTPGGYWRPLYALSISLDGQLWQNEAWLYHLENIGWHLAVVCGLLLLGERLLRGTDHTRQVSFWAALLFAACPLGVHSVTWISGRKDLMCAAFSIGSLLAFDRAAFQQEQRVSWPARAMWNLVSVLALTAALLSKELAIVTVGFAAVWLLFECRRDVIGWERRITRFSGFALMMLFLTAGGVVWWRIQAIGGLGLGGDYPAQTFFGNLAVSARLLCWYIFRTLLPVEPTIVDRWPVSDTLNAGDIAAIVGLCSGLWLMATGYLKRWTTWPAFAWFAIWLLPALGLLPLRHLYAERYLYPAAWGLMLAAVAFLHRELAGGSRLERALLTVIPLAGVLALTVSTARENLWWWSDQRLFEHALAQDPEYVEGLIGLGTLKLAEGDALASERLFREASAERDGSASYHSPFILHTNRGLALHHLGRIDEAALQFEAALSCRPNNALAHYHTALVAMARHDFPQAEMSLVQADSLQPKEFLTRSNLGYVKLQLGRLDEARAILEPLVEQQPDDAGNRANLGTVYLLLEVFAQAEEQFDWLVDHDPSSAVHRAKLAWAQLRQGKDTLAGQNVLEAARIAPDHPTVKRVAVLVMASLRETAPR